MLRTALLTYYRVSGQDGILGKATLLKLRPRLVGRCHYLERGDMLWGWDYGVYRIGAYPNVRTRRILTIVWGFGTGELQIGLTL